MVCIEVVRPGTNMVYYEFHHLIQIRKILDFLRTHMLDLSSRLTRYLISPDFYYERIIISHSYTLRGLHQPNVVEYIKMNVRNNSIWWLRHDEVAVNF